MRLPGGQSGGAAPRVAVPLGTAFWPFPTEAVPRPHPYFVIAGPVKGKVLAVNVTDLASFQFKVEHVCVLKAGDHPAITKDSAANFLPECPFEVPVDALHATLHSSCSKLRHLPDLKPALVDRLRQGAAQSAEMSPALKKKYGLT